MRVYPNNAVIMTVAKIFALTEMAPCRCQLRTIGPRRLLLKSHLCQRSLDLEKKKAAKRTKGVVGRIGKGIPKIAKAIETHPSIKNIVRLVCSNIESSLCYLL